MNKLPSLLKILWLALGLALASPCFAVDLDSLPEMADNSVCNIGSGYYFGRANDIAREMRIPAPQSYQEVWSILSDYLLESCSDKQLLIVADNQGNSEFAGSAMKLLKRVCIERDIVKTTDGKYGTKFSCQISKLNELRKAIGRPPGTVTRSNVGAVGPAPGTASGTSAVVQMANYDPYDKSPDNAPVEYVIKEWGGNQGGFLNSITKLLPDSPILNGIVTWSAAHGDFGWVPVKLNKFCESQGSQWKKIKPYDYDKIITPEIMLEVQMTTYKRLAAVGPAVDVNVARDTLLQSLDEAAYRKGKQANPYDLAKRHVEKSGIYQCNSDTANYWFAAIIPGELVSYSGRPDTTPYQKVFIQAIPRPRLVSSTTRMAP